jgi:hypothetical protein
MKSTSPHVKFYYRREYSFGPSAIERAASVSSVDFAVTRADNVPLDGGTVRRGILTALSAANVPRRRA